MPPRSLLPVKSGGQQKSANKTGKRVPWQNNPHILERLAKVEYLHLAGMRVEEIAAMLTAQTNRQISPKLIYVDLKRLETVWRERLGRKVEVQRLRSTAKYQSIQRRALENMRNAVGGLEKIAWTRLEKDCEDAIVKIQGTLAPLEIDLNAKFAPREQIAASVLERLAVSFNGKMPDVIDVEVVKHGDSSGGNGVNKDGAVVENKDDIGEPIDCGD